MTEIVVKSKVLSVLDELNIKYIIKNNIAFLVEHDSLSIQLTGKYQDSWKRWSTGDHGKNHIDLINYLVKIGTISSDSVSKIESVNIIPSKTIKVKKADKYIYKNEVINPNTWKIKKYLTRDRKISINIFNKFLSGNKFVQDGRDNLRFRLSDLKTGEIVGAEVKGIDISRKFQMILPGSEGYFFIKNSNIIENIIFFEAAIDLISYYELENFSSDQQEDSFYNFPIKRKNSLYISLAGSYTKIEKCFEVLVKEKLINSSTNIIIATDNDKSGSEVFNFFQKKGCKKLIRELPNQGVPYVNKGIKKTIKDWNELLQIIKEEDF